MEGQLDAQEQPRTLPTRRHLLAIAVAFTIVAIYGSLVPLRFQAIPLPVAIERFGEILRQEVGVVSKSDWLANILLFIPLGFFWLGSAALGKGWIRSVAWGAVVTAVLAALSAGLEFAQLWHTSRFPSQNDIAAETLGASIGVAAWLVFGPGLVHALQWLIGPRLPASRSEKLLLVYLTLFLVWAALPLDLTLSLSDLHHKWRNGGIRITPLLGWSQWDRAMWLKQGQFALLCIPLGALAAIASLKPGRSIRSPWKALLLGVALLAAVEAGQVFVLSRRADSSDLLSGSMGLLMGIGVARLQRSDSKKTI